MNFIIITFVFILNFFIYNVGFPQNFSPFSNSTPLELIKVSSDPNDVAFYLYANPNNFSDADQLIYLDLVSIKNSRYNISNPVILLSHGYTQTYLSQFPFYVKKAYLEAGYGSKANIIAVDWGKLSGQYNWTSTPSNVFPTYEKARENVYVVGKRVQEFLIFLIQNKFLSGPDKIHLIGQSLGAHVSGMAGYYFTNVTSTLIGRITGTDPAAALFQSFPINDRLDETDADFVDIVHTSQGQLGYLGRLGHVDFFVNGGGVPQPPCRLPPNDTDAFCSHNLAPRYYAKSIGDTSITAYKSTIPILSYFLGSTIFGEHCSPDARGSFYLNLDL